jgi:hypothetical protein
MNQRLQPAFWGGLFIGVLCALPLVSCCCCLWMLGGGALTVYLRQQNQPGIVPASEGAIMGLMAGVIGALITTVLSIPMTMMMGPFQEQLMERVLSSNPDFPQELRGLFATGAMGVAGVFLALLFNLVVMSIMGLLGGLLGVAVFQKNPPPPPPGTVEVLPPV